MRNTESLFIASAAVVVAACLGLVATGQRAKAAAASGDDAWRAYTKIETGIIVAATLAEAWKCWSTSEGAMTFFAPHVEIEARPGGPFEVWFNPSGEPGQRGAEGLKVLSALPGEMISFEWNAPPQFTHARPQKTWVVVSFSAVDAAHTRVRLVHLGWDEMQAKNPEHLEEWNKVKSYFEAAWPKVLGWMKQRFEEGPRWDEQGRPRWRNEQPK